VLDDMELQTLSLRPHRYQGMADTIVQLFCARAPVLIANVNYV
jgi:hypothetical protein